MRRAVDRQDRPRISVPAKLRQVTGRPDGSALRLPGSQNQVPEFACALCSFGVVESRLGHFSGRKQPASCWCISFEVFPRYYGCGWEKRAMFPPSYYSQRAAELEAMANGITDLTTREMCLDLARRFRDIANVKSVTQQSDMEVVHLAERMVGKTPRPDKH